MLQIFLYLNLILAGAAAAFAIRYGYEHYLTKKNLTTHEAEAHTADLSDASRAHLMREAETRFKAILENAAGALQDDLNVTGSEITGKMRSLGRDIVEVEMKRYTDSLEQLRHITEESVGLAAAAATKHQGELETVLQQRQKELEAALHKDMTAEKQRLVAELDKKLAGAVTSFLVETLGHNVDLGAQSTYLTEQLARHKDELVKELTDES